jgi:hypothetical protein
MIASDQPAASRVPRWAAVSALARAQLDHEWPALLLLGPMLMFPDRWRRLAVASACLFPLLWLLSSMRHRAELAWTPLRWPLLVLGATALVGTWISRFPDGSFPKLMGVVLGFAVYRATVASITTERRLKLAAWTFLALGTVAVCAGALATPWTSAWAPMLTSGAARLAEPGLETASIQTPWLVPPCSWSRSWELLR